MSTFKLKSSGYTPAHKHAGGLLVVEVEITGGKGKLELEFSFDEGKNWEKGLSENCVFTRTYTILVDTSDRLIRGKFTSNGKSQLELTMY